MLFDKAVAVATASCFHPIGLYPFDSLDAHHEHYAASD
jgi:hypothetical protein